MKNKRKRTKSTGIKREQLKPGCKVRTRKCLSYQPQWRGRVVTIMEKETALNVYFKVEVLARTSECECLTVYLQLSHLDPAYGVVTPK